MEASLRIFYLLKTRNFGAFVALRNYALYCIIVMTMIFLTMKMGKSPNFLIFAIMSVALMYLAERQFFPLLKSTNESMHFFGLPASQAEKWLAELIHTFLVLPLLVILPMLLIILVQNSLLAFGKSNVGMDALAGSLKMYWSLHPLLFFGAAYFKKSVLIKTFGAIALLVIGSVIYVFTVMGMTTDHSVNHISFSEGSFANMHMSVNSAKAIFIAGYYFLFWLLAYLAVTEAESR